MKHRIALVTVALVGGLVAVLTVLSIMRWTATAARAERWVGHSSTGPTAVSSRGITKVSQQSLSVLYVAPGGDCGGMSPCYGSIQMAVDAANTGDVIKVATGTYTDVSARAGVTQAVYISKTVTIHGGYTTVNWGVSDPEANPTILDAQGQGRVLYVSFCSPTIKSLNITGGYIYGEPWSARGAGVFLYYSDATLIGNTIYGNRAIGPGGSGGGVFLAERSDATLVGNVIRDNVATSGGGIHGDASFYADTYAMLISNIIRNNTAQRGGGVYLGIRGFRLINNVIADNYARISGSGVYVWGGDHRLIHNTIVRNTGGNGSGVFVSTYGSHIGTVAMTNTILADQMVGISIAAPQSTAILNGVLWSGNGANTGGAGSITVTNAITGSPAFVDPDGGDYHIGGTSAAVDRGLTVDFLLDMDEDYRFLAAPPDLGADEIVTTPAPQCQARLNGGGTIYPTLQAAIATSTSASDVVEVAGICEDVVPWNGGSVVAVLTRTLTVRGGYSPDFGTWDPNAYPTILGGRFQNRVLAIGAGVRPTVEYLTLFGGRAVGEGGGLWSEGDGPTLRHLQVSYSSAGRGGGIYLGGSNAYLEETRVVGNRASVGGGVYIQSITTTLNANLVHSNWAVDGGGVYLDESAVTLNGNIFTYNTSSWDGGGMYLYKSAAILGNNTFIGNISKYGGGTYLDTSEATFRDSIVSNNIARHGGGIYLYHSDATLSDNTIEGNTARDRDPYHGGTGGGVYLDYSDATLSGNVIRANTATGNGGGGYLIESAATLNGNVVSGNTAKGGGGLYLAWHSDAMLSKNTITDNSADYSGGGGYLSGSAATLNGNTISGNAANGLYWQCGETPCGGGGIHLDESPATLSANTITANTAQMNGGGLVMRHSNATLNGNIVGDNSADYGGGLALYQSDATGTNNAVFDNQANVAGSGLYVRESSPRLLHITIAGNSGGDGNGIYVAQTPCPYLDLPCVYSHVALTNTVLVDHTMGITVAANNTATLNGVLWFGNGTDTSGAGTITVSHAVTGDPAFATDGYHITVSSAAFDAGVDAGVTTDIDGDVRPKGSAPDLGADEISFTYVPPGSATNLVYTDSQGLTTTIQIPAGAVSETVALAYIPVDASPPPGFAFANHGFEMGVYWERGSAWLPGFTFNRPVTVTIHYSDQDVRVITDEHQLFLGWWTGDEWVDAFSTCDPHGSGALAPYLRDRERNVVGVPICHLSRFGLFGPTRRLVLPLVMRAK